MTRAAALAVAAVAMASLRGADAQAASQQGRLPDMVLAGPYGDPLALAPLLHPLGAAPVSVMAVDRNEMTLPVEGGPSPGASPPRTLLRPIGPTKLGEAGTRTVTEEDEAAAAAHRPGILLDFVKVPELVPVTKPRPGFGPHLTPDTEIPLGARTSMGLFGDVGSVEVGRTEVRGFNVPTLKAKEVGAGVSFQYRFGQ